MKEDWDVAERILMLKFMIEYASMRLLRTLLSALLISVLAHSVFAADSSAIQRAVDEFLRIQTKGLPGTASYSIGSIDADRLAGTCEGFDVSMGNGSRPWGKTQVVVRCRGGSWSLWVPVQIRVVAEYLVTSRPINAGQKITDADVRGLLGELSDLPNGVLMDKEQAIGRTAIASLTAGRPLRIDMLRQPTVIQQGQSVKIVGMGSGFQVANEGRALTNAMVGQVAQVRLNSGQILSGVVRSDGSIEVRF